MKAKYIGNSSLGFVHNETYDIDIYMDYVVQKKYLGPNKKVHCICIFDIYNHHRWCPYESINVVFRFWEFDDDNKEKFLESVKAFSHYTYQKYINSMSSNARRADYV